MNSRGDFSNPRRTDVDAISPFSLHLAARSCAADFRAPFCRNFPPHLAAPFAEACSVRFRPLFLAHFPPWLAICVLEFRGANYFSKEGDCVDCEGIRQKACFVATCFAHSGN
jgi:hypothetical protein